MPLTLQTVFYLNFKIILKLVFPLYFTYEETKAQQVSIICKRSYKTNIKADTTLIFLKILHLPPKEKKSSHEMASLLLPHHHPKIIGFHLSNRSIIYLRSGDDICRWGTWTLKIQSDPQGIVWGVGRAWVSQGPKCFSHFTPGSNLLLTATVAKAKRTTLHLILWKIYWGSSIYWKKPSGNLEVIPSFILLINNVCWFLVYIIRNLFCVNKPR